MEQLTTRAFSKHLSDLIHSCIQTSEGESNLYHYVRMGLTNPHWRPIIDTWVVELITVQGFHSRIVAVLNVFLIAGYVFNAYHARLAVELFVNDVARWLLHLANVYLGAEDHQQLNLIPNYRRVIV